MWTSLIPTSMAMVGSICLGLAVILVLIDMPGGVNWSKVAAWMSIIGGFGAVGGAGGWLGQQVMDGRGTAMSLGERWIGQLVGAGALAVVMILLLAWAYSRVGKGGKGIEVKGNGKTKKIKALLVCGAFAVVGATIAALVPELYSLTDTAVSALGTRFVSLAS